MCTSCCEILAYCCTSMWCNSDLLYDIFFQYSFARCREWIKNCGVQSVRDMPWQELYNKARLCHLHFEDWCFMNPAMHNKLVWNAVPILFEKLPHPPKQAQKRPPPKPRHSPPPPKRKKKQLKGNTNILTKA